MSCYWLFFPAYSSCWKFVRLNLFQYSTLREILTFLKSEIDFYLSKIISVFGHQRTVRKHSLSALFSKNCLNLKDEKLRIPKYFSLECSCVLTEGNLLQLYFIFALRKYQKTWCLIYAHSLVLLLFQLSLVVICSFYSF
jgi:hypothetical protein